MDLLDFVETELYFDEPLSTEVSQLLATASAEYGSLEAELALLRASVLSPKHLSVLVALYRYYFYQHRLVAALQVAERALFQVGLRLALPDSWRNLSESAVAAAGEKSMGLLRFYLMVLKSAGYLNLRMGNYEMGQAMLEKLVELDSHDRMGGNALLDVLKK